MKKTKFPSDNELDLVRKKLNTSIGSRPFPANGDSVEKIKYKTCEQFIIYKRDNSITQRELARIIGIDEALTSKILHYHTEEFSIDRLIRYLSLLYPKVDVSLKVA